MQNDEFCTADNEEADTIIAFHLCKVPNNCNVTITCSVMEVFIMAQVNLTYVNANVNVWMQVSIEYNEWFINVNNICES